MLEEQDRSRWDHLRFAGRGVTGAGASDASGRPYQLQASIAALHAEAPTAADTDWPQIVALYDALARLSPLAGDELNGRRPSRWPTDQRPD